MKYLSLKFLSLFLIVSSLSFSQDKKEVDNTKTKKTSEILNYRESVSDFLQISQIEKLNTRQDFSNLQDNRNVTIIQQVGNQNRALTNTVSNTSDIRYLQIGYKNAIESVNTISNNKERVVQTGVNNSLTNFSFGTINTSNLNVIQTGNNLKFEKFGSNAQTNSMKFKITGNNQTVIVRSF